MEVLPSSSGQDTSHIGLGPTLMTASYFNHLFEVPFSKYGHIPRAPGIRRSTCELEGGGAQASQPIPGEMMKILYLGTALEKEYKVKGTNCARPHEAWLSWLPGAPPLSASSQPPGALQGRTLQNQVMGILVGGRARRMCSVVAISPEHAELMASAFSPSKPATSVWEKLNEGKFH